MEYCHEVIFIIFAIHKGEKAYTEFNKQTSYKYFISFI